MNTNHIILVVDDDDAFRASMMRLFHSMRRHVACTVNEASDGRSALAVLKECKVDCVLLDYQMPGGTGLEWMSAFMDASPGTTVIMVTGAGDETIAVEAMKAGATDYLVKGAISPESLRRALINALQKKEMADTIKIQHEKLLDAERHRVMIESLGAACHHLSQPVTVIRAYLEIMNRREQPPEMHAMVADSLEAAEKVSEILHRLMVAGDYRTEPYIPVGVDGVARGPERILKI